MEAVAPQKCSEIAAECPAHPSEVCVYDGGAALTAGKNDSGVDYVCQHGAGEVVELEGQIMELLLCDVVLPALPVRQPLSQMHLHSERSWCMRRLEQEVN